MRISNQFIEVGGKQDLKNDSLTRIKNLKIGGKNYEHAITRQRLYINCISLDLI